jgi:hypothetical protein
LWYRNRIVEKHRRMNQMQKTNPAGQRRSPKSMRRRAGNIRICRKYKDIQEREDDFLLHTCCNAGLAYFETVSFLKVA